MDTTAILAEFRRIATEFADKTDTEVTEMISVYADMVGQKVFGRFYARAVACIVAHYMKLEDMIGSGDISSLVGGEVIMEKEGDLQRQYSQDDATSGTYNEALLKKTVYGKLFLSLRALCVMPVMTRMG